MASVISAGHGLQMPPLQQLYQDVNTTKAEVKILADDVSELNDMIMEINNISRGPPGENKGIY